MSIEQRCYSAWRRSEAYTVPVTEQGIEDANERYKQFKKGYMAAIKECSYRLEVLHGHHKKAHSFFLVASKFLKECKYESRSSG